MNRNAGRLLFWSPRVLSIAYGLFISIFALDVFEEGRGFWPTLAALVLHLIPTAMVVIALMLGWRWEWVGAVLFTVLAALYGVWSLPRHAGWFMGVGVPLLIIAGLFLAGWIKRTELRPAH